MPSEIAHLGAELGENNTTPSAVVPTQGKTALKCETVKLG